MTPNEQQMLDELLQNLRSAGAGAPHDPDAERYLADEMQRNPQLTYLLAQRALVLQIGLQEADRRIADLQRQTTAGYGRPSGTSFLGGLFGGGQAAAPRQPQSPWSGGAGSVPYTAPTPMAGSAGGGMSNFLRGAAQMATGVAGGYLLAEGLSSMFGGHAGGSWLGGPAEAAQPTEYVENVTNNYYGPDDQMPDQADDLGNADDLDTGADYGGDDDSWT